MKFKVGEKVAVNTTKYDDFPGDEYGKIGTIAKFVNDDIYVSFPEGEFPQGETFGSYGEEDLRPLTKLEKALR